MERHIVSFFHLWTLGGGGNGNGGNGMTSSSARNEDPKEDDDDEDEDEDEEMNVEGSNNNNNNNNRKKESLLSSPSLVEIVSSDRFLEMEKEEEEQEKEENYNNNYHDNHDNPTTTTTTATTKHDSNTPKNGLSQNDNDILTKIIPNTASTDQMLFVSSNDLRQALRRAFLRLPTPPTLSESNSFSSSSQSWYGEGPSNSPNSPNNPNPSPTTIIHLTKSDIGRMQRFAMESLKLFQIQYHTWMHSTSVHIDPIHHVRVIATSRCIGTSAVSSINDQLKSRFAYRIRIENLHSNSTRNSQTDNGTDTDVDVDVDVDVDTTSNEKEIQETGIPATEGHGHAHAHTTTTNTSLQLLGRTWNIHEDGPINDDRNTIIGTRETMTIRAPTTGAVGHLPVLKPGEIFEYMSGCELGTKTGSMDGYFHMAKVDMDTPSAQVGDYVKAFHSEEDQFVVPIRPFGLITDDDDDDDGDGDGDSVNRRKW